MRDPMTPLHSPELEKKLDALYSAIVPNPEFAQRLEMQLTTQARKIKKPAQWMEWTQLFTRRPVLAAGLMIGLVLVLFVSLSGPQKVLAEVQRLLGFVPGGGFVQPGETRVLPAPVEVRQGDVTLQIQMVIADSHQTQVYLIASGLPKEKFSGDTGPNHPMPYLLLPDGTHLVPGASSIGIGENLQASLTFPALPTDANQVTLVLPRLPALPSGFAPENWSVVLQLQPVSTLPNAYSPSSDLSTANGVTVQVLQVGKTDQETGIQLRFHWENPDWQLLSNVDIHLTDETGRNYMNHPATIGPGYEADPLPSSSGALVRTYRFDSFNSQAHQAALTIDTMLFTFSSQAHFTFNPGQNASSGQMWDLSGQPGTLLDVAGLPVKVLSVQINPSQETHGQAPYLLDVLVQAKPQDGHSLQNLVLSLEPDRAVSSSCELLPDNQFRMTIGLAELPKGPLILYLLHGNMSVAGPWHVNWSIPTKP